MYIDKEISVERIEHLKREKEMFPHGLDRFNEGHWDVRKIKDY